MFHAILSSIRHSLKSFSNGGVMVVRNKSTKDDKPDWRKYMKPEVKKCFKPEGKKCPSKHTPLIPIVCEGIYAKDKDFDDKFEKCLLKNAGHVTPACTTKFFERIPCSAPLPKPAIKRVYIGPTAWENPPCCRIRNNCFRYDVSYLKPEEKCFQRTWCEFPPNRCKVKLPRCKQQRIIVADMEIRPRGQINKAATKSQPPISLEPKCVKVKWPGCRRARKNPKCVIQVRPKCCKKRCTLYPSFSECCRRRPKALRKVECGCLDPLGKCTIYHPFLLKDYNED